jgi:hypothetical protein
MQLKYFTEKADRHPPSATLWDDVDTSKKPPHNWAFEPEKLAIDIIAKAFAEGPGHKGPDDADFALLRLARDQELAGLPRALEIMDYFLSGSAHHPRGRRGKLVFKMSSLLAKCAGARARVGDEIRKRIHDAAATSSRHRFGNVYAAQWGDKDPRKIPWTYDEFEFSIGQGHYRDLDWQRAIGTFFCIWVPDRSHAMAHHRVAPQYHGVMTATQDRKPAKSGSSAALPTRAIVGGKKIWHWHSKTDRTSEAVHQAAYRLVKKGKLFNFRVEAEPCVIEIATGWPVHDAAREMEHR